MGLVEGGEKKCMSGQEGRNQLSPSSIPLPSSPSFPLKSQPGNTMFYATKAKSTQSARKKNMAHMKETEQGINAKQKCMQKKKIKQQC